MAIFGRSQPTTGVIIKRLIQFQPAVAPAASKPLVVSFAANTNRRPVPFTRVIINRRIRYQPIPPTASKPYIATIGDIHASRRPKFSIITNGLIQEHPRPPIAAKPFLVTQTAVEFRKPQILRPSIGRSEQFAALVDPVADTPYLVTWQAVSFRRPQILRPFFGRLLKEQRPPVARAPYIATLWPRESTRKPHPGVIIGRLIKYAAPAPTSPIAAKPFIVSFVAHNFRRPEFHGPIMNRLYPYQPMTPPIRLRPVIVSQIARDEAYRRSRTLTVPRKIVTEPVIPPAPRVHPKFKIQHEEAAKTQRHRQHEQQVKRLINELLRNGQIIGTLDDPMLGYVASDPQAVGTTEPLTIAEVLDRIIAYIKSQNGTGI